MSEACRILHFTDPHLFADRAGEMRGVRTLDSMQHVVSEARNNHYPADAILVTGDIAQDHSRGAYELLSESFADLGLPVFCLPGNHDAPWLMQEMLATPPFQYCGSTVLGNWLIILLDTHSPGDAGGRIQPTELDALDDQLAANGKKHVLIALHHHPVSSGSRWLDTVALRNAADLWEVLNQHDHVRCVLWGHVHQEFEQQHGSVKLLATPSTCRQFLPNQAEFRLDDQPPAYRWIDLQANGSIATAVAWCHEQAILD